MYLVGDDVEATSVGAVWCRGVGPCHLIVAILVLQCLTLVIHERGHGLTVYRSGRQVRQAALLIYLGLPGAYVDTSDAWLPTRKDRMIITAAGPLTGFAAMASALRSACWPSSAWLRSSAH